MAKETNQSEKTTTVSDNRIVLDWQGKPVEVEETDDTEIYVWEISPHPQTDDYDSCWVRGYQKAREFAELSMERVMDGNDFDELTEGVKVEVKLIKTTVGELNEVYEDIDAVVEFLCPDGIWRKKWLAQKCGDTNSMKARMVKW